jgi:Activator of osmoprotectant transporter ProP
MSGKKLTLKATLSPEKLAELNRLKYMKRDTYVRRDQEASRKLLRETFHWLYKTFPKAFNRLKPVPLKLQIEQDIFTKLPEEGDLSRKKIRLALKVYTRGEAYHKAIVDQEWRMDLNGNQAEQIQEDHKSYAKERLEKIRLYKESQAEKKRQEAEAKSEAASQ